MTTTQEHPAPARAQCSAAERLVRAAILAAAAFLLTGCLSMTRGTKQRVWVTSEPAGAAVTVDGQPVGVTPTQVTVTRAGRHEVSIVRDSLRVDTVLARYPTPVLFAYLLLSVPGLVFAGVDLLTGAAITVSDANVVLQPAQPGVAAMIAAAPATPVKKVLPVIDLPLKRDDRLRFAKLDVAEPAAYVVVDSVDAVGIYGRNLSEPETLRPDTAVVIGAGDVRRVSVYLPPDRTAGGLAMTRQSVRAMAPFLAFPQGEMVALLAYPAGWATGATLAEPRWSPREAHRVGSPLLVNDSLEVRLADHDGSKVSGRLLDLDRNDLLLASAGAHIRVPRKEVSGLKRANGYHFLGTAILGTLAGAFVGSTACRISDICRRAGVGSRSVQIGGALTGLLASPAFAPRRWSEVERW